MSLVFEAPAVGSKASFLCFLTIAERLKDFCLEEPGARITFIHFGGFAECIQSRFIVT